MDIKDKLVLNGMTWTSADKIEYNTIGAFQTSDSNTLVYYIFRCTDNTYTLQEQYTWHSFDPLVVIPERELFCPKKVMTQMRKTSYWYHESYKTIPVMVKLKQVMMPYI